MLHSSLRVHFLFPHEHFKTTFFEAFPVFRYYSVSVIKYLLRNIRHETSESKVNGVKDS